MIRIGVLIVFSIATAGCPATASPRVTVVEDIIYGQGETAGGDLPLEADLYLPDPPLSPMPAVVMFHAGGWLAAFGGRASIAELSEEIASHGFAVLNCEYRLDTDVATVPSADEARFQTAYPFLAANTAKAGAAACIDMRTAVRWLKANAETYRIDPDQIVLAGASAGAINALTCLYAPSANFTSTHASNHLGENHDVIGAVSYSGSAEVALDEGWIDAGDGPAMIWHGDADDNAYTDYDDFIVPLLAALDTAGTPYDDYIEPGGGHLDYTEHAGLGTAATFAAWFAGRFEDPRHITPVLDWVEKTIAVP